MSNASLCWEYRMKKEVLDEQPEDSSSVWSRAKLLAGILGLGLSRFQQPFWCVIFIEIMMAIFNCVLNLLGQVASAIVFTVKVAVAFAVPVVFTIPIAFTIVFAVPITIAFKVAVAVLFEVAVTVAFELVITIAAAVVTSTVAAAAVHPLLRQGNGLSCYSEDNAGQARLL
ncbi:hypothetical protein FS837_012737 [Tulasnella sp. UAMH 9824]|nr:hypothetical protein FS837_012737 [Tulasnella sp. UAMH 9824]